MGQVDNSQPLEDARTRVFLSYSRKDAALVAQVADGLMAAGFLADYDQAAHDPGNVSSGISAEDEWWKRLQEMIASADVMVFLVSPDSAASTVCDEEIAYARALGKRIIAVLARPVDFAKAPPRLSALNVRIDFSEGGPGFEAALAGLVSALQMNVGWHREGRKYLARVQEWDTRGRPRSLLLREGAVEEAERWALARPRNEPEAGELFLAWIAESRDQIKRDAARRAFWRRVTAVFVLTTLFATLAGAWFVINGQRDLGRSESLMLARTSDQFYNAGDNVRALHLAILASRDTFLAPSTDEARAAFAKSASALRMAGAFEIELAPFEEIEEVVPMAGGRLLVKTTFQSIELWDLMTSTRLAGPVKAEDDSDPLYITLSGDRSLALLSGQRELFGVNAATGQIFGPLKPEAAYGGWVGVLGVAGDGAVFIARDVERGLSVRDGRTGERISVIGEGEGVTSFASLSGDGALAAVVTNDEAGLWLMAEGRRAGAAHPRNSDVTHAPFLSPDGTRLVVSAENEGALYFAVANGELSLLGALGESPVNEAQFVGTAGRLVTLNQDGFAQIFDMATGAPVSEPWAHQTSSLRASLYEMQGVLLASSYLTGITAISLQSGGVIGALPGEDFTAGIAAPEREGFYAWNGRNVDYVPLDLAEGSGQFWEQPAPDTSAWDTNTEAIPLDPPAPDEAYRVISEHPGFIEQVSLSPDGRQLLTYSSDGEIRAWNARTGLQEGPAYPHENYLVQDGFLDTEGHILSVLKNRIYVWQTNAYTRSGPPRLMDGDPIYSSQMSPDGRFLLAWTQAGRAILWDVEAQKTVGPGLLTGEQGFWVAEFEPQGRWMALSFENNIQIIDTATGEGRETLLEGEHLFTALQFSADGRRLVTNTDAGVVTVWDVEAMAALGEPIETDLYGTVPAEPAHNRAVVWKGAEARLLDLTTGAQIGAAMVHSGDPENAAIAGADFSADGRFVVTWSETEVRLWNAVTGAPAGEPLQPEERPYWVVLSDNGARMMMQVTSGAQVYDTGSGAPAGPALSPARQSTAAFSGGALSPDGELAAIWADDASTWLFEVKTGLQRGVVIAAGMYGQEGRFSPDGKRLLLSEIDGTHRIIDTVTGDMISLLSQVGMHPDSVWQPEAGRLVMHTYEGDIRTWDISEALRTDVKPADVAAVCAARLKGSDFVRKLDAEASFAAPILRGREGEDVCAVPVVPWWEQAAGVVFGWAFR